MRLQVGERVEYGAPVFDLIESPPNAARGQFKETKLSYMREGQEVTVVADARPDTLSALR